MRILYFHQHFSTPSGSTGTRSYEMAQKLLSEGHSVTMVCGSYSGGQTGLTSKFYRGKRTGNVDGIDVIEFDLSYANSTSFIARIWLFLRYALKSTSLVFTEKYDVVFATTTPLTAGIPGIVAKLFRRKPFVFEVRDLWPELPKKMGIIKNPLLLGTMTLLEKMSYRFADVLIGLSPGIVNGIEKGLGSKHTNIHMVPNGCDFRVFDTVQQATRPEDVNTDDLLVLFSGTHGQANGLNALLDVASQLMMRNEKNIKFVLVGQGKEKPTLQKRAEQEQLTNVIFLPPISKIELAKLMHGADLGAQILSNIPAFYYGTSPNKFFDYISASLPVINNYPGWLANMIDENCCGYVVPPEQPDVFADTLIAIAKDKSQLKEKALNARNLALQFRREKLADDWYKAIKEAM